MNNWEDGDMLAAMEEAFSTRSIDGIMKFAVQTIADAQRDSDEDSAQAGLVMLMVAMEIHEDPLLSVEDALDKVEDFTDGKTFGVRLQGEGSTLNVDISVVDE